MVLFLEGDAPGLEEVDNVILVELIESRVEEFAVAGNVGNQVLAAGPVGDVTTATT